MNNIDKRVAYGVGLKHLSEDTDLPNPNTDCPLLYKDHVSYTTLWGTKVAIKKRNDDYVIVMEDFRCLKKESLFGLAEFILLNKDKF